MTAAYSLKVRLQARAMRRTFAPDLLPLSGLAALTDAQLDRIARKLISRACAGFDWPTLRIVRPAAYASLCTLRAEWARRHPR